jgi:hypothetical protein
MSTVDPASTAICVLGMHRSGTSAMAGLLRLLGVDLGRYLMAPAADNPKGFWEHGPIVRIHAAILEKLGSHYADIRPLPDGWMNRPEIAPLKEQLRRQIQDDFGRVPLWGFKDPRACLLIPIWRDLFQEGGIHARYILVARNPLEIAESMTSRSIVTFKRALLSTLLHLLEAERQTRGAVRVVVPYAELMADWRRQVEWIGAALGIRWPNAIESIAGKVSEFLDPGLRHHVSVSGESAAEAALKRGAHLRLVNWVLTVHEVWTAAAADQARMDQVALDRIHGEVDAEWRSSAAARGESRGRGASP